MDPISQAALGTTATQSVLRSPKNLLVASILGSLGGMAPDLDVLITSNQDPLLFLEYHRQFTHSLFFIPLGGLIVALALYLWSRRHMSFRESYFFVTLGYATHGLLDACTTYGTQLFWPFSYERIAWNNVSVVDPAFTVPLLILCSLAVIRKQPWFGRVAALWALSYLIIGLVQRFRAEEFAREELGKQGIHFDHVSAKPSFANLLVWKIVSQTKDEFRVDAVRAGFNLKFFPGEKIYRLNLEKDFPTLPSNSLQARDIERFRWFSDDHLAVSKTDPHLIIDVRYSMVANEISGLWGIRIDPNNPEKHVSFEAFRDTSDKKRRLFMKLLLE